MAWDIGAIEYGASQTPVPGPTTPPTTTPPPSFPPTGPGGAGDLAQIPIRQGGAAVFILGRIFLDSGTEYESTRQVIHPSHVYQARVKQWGYVDRSIPVPTGLPQLGDCRIQLIDTDQYFRETLAHQTPRRRLLDLRLAVEGESESLYEPFATFEIVDMEFPAGLVEVSGRDINFAWLDKKIVSPINRVNFPTLMEGVDEVFPPIMFGIIDAPGDTSPPVIETQGLITLPRMTATRWALSQAPILNVDLGRKHVGENEFSAVSSSEYVITEQALTFDGLDYTLEFIDFFSAQDEGMELRITRANGIWFRGAFGSMPAVSSSPLQPLRNPVDCLINMLYAILKTETRIPRFNIDSFATTRAQFETLNTSTSPIEAYFCDGAIVEPMTAREFIAQWMTSFECDFYANRFGELELNLTIATDPDRPVFSDGPIFGENTDQSLIGINSVRQRLANPTCNRLRYNFCQNYSTGQFGQKFVYDNADDQAALGAADSPPSDRIEEEIVEFKLVRDTGTALDVARRRMEFLALGSYRIEFQLPLPQVFNDVELAKLIGVTHYGGLEVGGYHNEEFKTTGLTYDLDQMRLTLRGIRREPQSVTQIVEEQSGFFTGSIALPMLSTTIFNAGTSRRWFATDMRIDPDDYQTMGGASAIVNAWFEAEIADASQGGEVENWYLLDENDTVRATITTDGVPGRGNVRYRVALNVDLNQPRTYRLKNGDAGFNTTCNVCSIFLDVENAYRVKVMAAFIVAGDESTASAGFRATEALDNTDLWCLNNSDLTYAAGSVDYYGGDGQIHWVGKFLKDEAKFATIESWEFEGTASQFLFLGSGGEASSNGYMALFNKTTNSMVAGTELTFPPGVSRQSVTFSNSAANFTNLNEFEPRFKVQNNSETIGVARAAVYCTLTACTKALYVAGRVLNGNQIPFVTPVLNTEGGRYYHDGTKFPDTTKFYYELTGHQGGTSAPEAFMNDCGTLDWGYQSANGVPSAAAALSGSWSNPSNAADDGQEGGPLVSTSALFSSSTSGAVGELQTSSLVFTPSIPGSVSITLVNVFLRYFLEGQSALISARVNGNSYHNFFSPVGVINTQEHMYDATNDAAWVPSSFGGSCTVDIKATHPANVTLTNWWINGLVLVVGWSDLLVPSELNFTSTVRVRQRTAALTLINGHRYNALHPGSDTGSNKILHANGLILAEVDMDL